MSTLSRLIAVCALTLLECVAAPSFAQERVQERFTFGLFGDLAYRPPEEPLLANVLADLDRAALAFVVHVGDLGSPRAGSCSDELWARRLAQFRASAHPLIYIPGDNDWTDCHDAENVIGGDPLERLQQLRVRFFAGEQSLGRRSMPLLRQSADPRYARFRENVRWERGGVTFLTLHVVGSNNGMGRTPAGDAEAAERTSADIAWMRAGFAHARASGSRAVMVIQQANIFPELPPFPGGGKASGVGFVELRAALREQAAAFGKPVVLVHGDSHYFRIDKPFLRLRVSASEPAIENFTRLETFGSPHHHWVEVTVDPADPEVFTFRPRIVAANVLPIR